MDCFKETNISLWHIPLMISSELNFKSTPDLYCFTKCLYTKRKLLDKSGRIDEKMVKSVFDKNQQSGISDFIRECNKLTGSDKCLTEHYRVFCVLSKYSDKFL
mgnify:CR=1 FL=1